MAAARELLDGETSIDAAMMDVHIRGERVFPLCDVLEAKGVPFVLTSGYAGLANARQMGRSAAAQQSPTRSSRSNRRSPTCWSRRGA